MSVFRIFCFMLLLIIKCKVLCFGVEEDYFWRPYTGTIPKDAIIAGQDVNHEYVYIGQGYVKNYGLIVVQINKNQKEVEAAMAGVQRLKEHIKILCGFQSNFRWLRTSAATLHVDLIEKHSVIGGHQDGYGYLNIGRISYGGNIHIGKVNAFTIGDAGMWFPENGAEKNVKAYEVLYYENNPIDPRYDLSSANNTAIFVSTFSSANSTAILDTIQFSSANNTTMSDSTQ